MKLERLLGHLYSGLQGFALGAILMAYVVDYNRSQLPMAFIFLIISIALRFIK